MLIRQHREHALQPLVGEFHDPPTAFTDQVLVVRLPGHRLVPAEAFAELVGPDQPAFDQQVQGAVDGGDPYLFAPLLELAADPFDRQVVVGEEKDLGDQIPLAGNRLVVLPEILTKALEEGGAFRFIQAHH